MAKAPNRSFGRRDRNNPESTNVVTDEAPEISEIENDETTTPEITEENSEMTAETVTENTETATSETPENATPPVPAFDLSDLPVTGNDMVDMVAKNAAERIKEMVKLADELSKNSNLTNDNEVLNFAKADDADSTVKAIYADYEEMQKALTERFESLKNAVLSAKGITPLTPEKVEAKTTEFETTRTKAIAGIDGLKSLIVSFDNIPETANVLAVNLRASIPVLPGQRKVSGTAKQDAGGSKPRLGNGFVEINGENVGKNIAPAVKILNGKMPSGSSEISPENFIGAWLSAAGVSRWQDAPEDTTFEINGLTVHIKFLPKNPGA